jgi:hypothetical protein
MNDTPTIMFYENSRFWDDAMSVTGADAVKTLLAAYMFRVSAAKKIWPA